ncbi:uncharacterized protein LOC120508212 [Passer montanus]|uniref:uncharacterized protein LOC120508212 n=1 Tax=Passer montanus TaxID=9160 RepID=UPI0019602E01|nr:uncharacterized protein LOC120508212 [Passer montanus]
MEACHPPQQSNVTSYGATTVAIITVEAFAGMWMNAFIVCVLCIAWVKKKTLNSNEKILLLLGCSRISYLCFTWVSHFLSILYPDFLNVHTILQLIATLQTFFNYSNLWVSACLCGFYCIKIANFSNSFFIYLKVKIDRMVPWLLLGSEILALAMGMVVSDLIETVQRENCTFTSQENFWEARIKIDKHFFSSYFIAGFGYAASFMVVIFSAVCLLFSLWRHKRRMQTNSMKDLSMDAHIRAMKSVLSFLVMYSINFVCLVLSIIFCTKKANAFPNALCFSKTPSSQEFWLLTEVNLSQLPWKIHLISSTSYGVLTVAIITLEVFAGMWINAFIVCVLCIAWAKKKTLNSNEKILLLLAFSRISILCFSWIYHFILIIYPKFLHDQNIRQVLESSGNILNYSNLWVSACLCGFYCIKIANFRNSYFIFLKVKIDRMVPWLLLGSEILALAMGVVVSHLIETVQRENHNFTSQGNFWEERIRTDKHFFLSLFLAGFGYSASFMVVIFSAVCLLFSLWRHKCRMQTNSMKDLSMDAHIRAMKSILSFLVMYSINFVCLVLTIIFCTKKENIMTLLILTYLCAFPGAHSLILIFSNPKLEKELIKILSWVKCEFLIK